MEHLHEAQFYNHLGLGLTLVTILVQVEQGEMGLSQRKGAEEGPQRTLFTTRFLPLMLQPL